MKAVGIWMNNAFQVGEPVQRGGEDEDGLFHRESGAEVEQAVFERSSRFNHCCRPNAEHSWDNLRGRKSVRALRAIAIGEQIFVSYIGGASAVLRIPRAKRQETLQQMLGFACTCSRCLRGDEADLADGQAVGGGSSSAASAPSPKGRAAAAGLCCGAKGRLRPSSHLATGRPQQRRTPMIRQTIPAANCCGRSSVACCGGGGALGGNFPVESTPRS